MVLVRKEKSRHVKNRGFKHYLSHVTVPCLLKVYFLQVLDYLNMATEDLTNLQNGLQKNNTTGNIEPFPEHERDIVHNPYTNQAEQLTLWYSLFKYLNRHMNQLPF